MSAVAIASRRRVVAIASLGVLLYSAAAHFASLFYYAFPARWPMLQSSQRIHSHVASVTVYYAGDLLALALIYAAYGTLSAEERPDLRGRSSTVWWCFAGGVCGVAYFFVGQLIIWLGRLGGFYTRDILSAFGHPSLPIICLVAVNIALISPVVQEVVFRGWLLSGLLPAIGATRAILVSSAVFALLHFSLGVPMLVQSFFFGLLAGVLFCRTKSIFPSIALHIATNSIATLMWIFVRLHR